MRSGRRPKDNINTEEIPLPLESTAPANPPNDPQTDPAAATKAQAADFDRISRDERNLATYPIAMLSYKPGATKTISQTRERRHPITKKTITAVWEVLGSDKWGLPTPVDDAVVLVLVELSRELGFPQDVYFTQTDILKRLGWPDNQTSYDKLSTVFHRLNALTIQSQNVFWDAKAQAFANTGFHFFETFKIISKPGRRSKANPELTLSWFRWGEPLWHSFRDGNLKPISLGFYFSLHFPVARRLYRFLDLVAYDGKPKYRIGLKKLCEEYLGLSHSPYPSIYKNTLLPGHDELIQAGYLRNVYYEKAKSGGENVVYEFPDRENVLAERPADGGKSAPGPAPAEQPSPLSFSLSLELADKEQRDAACDAVFQTLPLSEQDRIRQSATKALPQFLRENMNTAGAKNTLLREIRTTVEYEHSATIEQHLKKQVEESN